MRHIAFAALSVCAVGLVAEAAQADSNVLYREVFPTDLQTPGTPAPLSRKERVFENGWFGEQHGSLVIDADSQDLQISESPGVTPELPPVGNTPVGNTLSSFAFYSPSNRAGIYMGTFEYTMPVANLEWIEWASRSSAGARGPNDDTGDGAGTTTESDQHIWLLVDGAMFVSQEGTFLEDPDNWNTITVDPTTQLYNRYDVLNDGEPVGALPRFSGDGDDTGFAFNELGTTLEGFGIWVKKNLEGDDGRATYRIDNFTLKGIPSPGAAGALALGGLLGLRRRR